MTYSRASYTGTTIGPAAFHGRVRNGNGWDHRGKTTGKLATAHNVLVCFKSLTPLIPVAVENRSYEIVGKFK